MSTQNLQSAESRKINKSFFEGQSRVSYLTRDFLSVEGKVRKGEALAGLPLSPPPLPRFPLPPYLCHRLDSLISFGYTSTSNTQNIKSEV